MNKSLRIIMKTAFLDVFLPAEQAQLIYTKWVSREYHVQGMKVISGTDIYGHSWAVELEHVTGFYIGPMPPEAVQPVKSVLDKFGPFPRTLNLSGGN